MGIKTLTGRKTNFNFELDNTVRQVKEALQEKEGIQVEQIRLIYSGKQMSDECALQDYNVKPGSTVHMVLQLRGGARAAPLRPGDAGPCCRQIMPGRLTCPC